MDDHDRINTLHSEIETLKSLLLDEFASALNRLCSFIIEYMFKTQDIRIRLDQATWEQLTDILEGADKNNDTAEHSEGMLDMQRDILRRAEDGQAADRESDGADLPEMPGRKTAEGAAELPPGSETEQGQAPRLLKLTLSKEDAENLLDLVEVNYNEVLKAKNCSSNDDCHELAADLNRLYENLQIAIFNANKPSWIGDET